MRLFDGVSRSRETKYYFVVSNEKLIKENFCLIGGLTWLYHQLYGVNHQNLQKFIKAARLSGRLFNS